MQTNSRTQAMVAVRINSLLLKTELAGRHFPVEEVKKTHCCVFSDTDSETLLCACSDHFYFKWFIWRISQFSQTQVLRRKQTQPIITESVGPLLPNVLIFPFPFSSVATYWLFPIVLNTYICSMDIFRAVTSVRTIVQGKRNSRHCQAKNI